MDNLNNKGTILLVDDDQFVLDVGTMMIRKLGYRALQAASGTEANQIFCDNIDDICLVLLDINLRDENGIDTCVMLKRIDSNVRVIHTSGFGAISTDHTFDCGCLRYLAKPFTIAELSNKIKECLETADDQEMLDNKNHGVSRLSPIAHRLYFSLNFEFLSRGKENTIKTPLLSYAKYLGISDKHIKDISKQIKNAIDEIQTHTFVRYNFEINAGLPSEKTELFVSMIDNSEKKYSNYRKSL